MSEYGRLRWHCRRGMKELDELLAGFLERGFDAAPVTARAAFAALLERPDPEVYALLSGQMPADDPALADVIARIRRTADA